jgi:hypothetical protein
VIHHIVTFNDKVDADASGGSHVRYLGNPTMGTIDVDVVSSIKTE